MMCRHSHLEHPRIAAQRSKSRAKLKNPWHIRFGSKADIGERLDDVRFTLKADIAERKKDVR